MGAGIIDLDGATILVAGGTGLGGSAVVRALLSAMPNIRIKVPHRGRHGCFVSDPRVTYVQCDLTRPEDARLVASGCDMAVMAAARVGGSAELTQNPWAQVGDNVVLDCTLFEALHACGVRRVVYVSTATVYANADGVLKETDLDLNCDPAPAHFGVGWAKRYGETLCRFWQMHGGMSCPIIRLANIYGPWARFDPARSNFVAALVRKAVMRQDPFEIWGAREVTRDILYVDDFARAVVSLLERQDVEDGVFNIGSGQSVSVGEVAAWACQAVGYAPSNYSCTADAPTTIQHRRLDCSQARDVLGWQAEITPEEGIRRTVAWWQANQETWTR